MALWTDDQVAYLCELSWDNGRAYEHRRITAAAAEVDEAWNRRALPTLEQRIAERIAEMEAHSAATHRRLGHPPGYEYRGGPVQSWDLT